MDLTVTNGAWTIGKTMVQPKHWKMLISPTRMGNWKKKEATENANFKKQELTWIVSRPVEKTAAVAVVQDLGLA